MATDSGYEKGNYLRVCDICGHRFHFRDLRPIGELRFACPDDAPGLTSLQISRANARARPLVVRPNKWAKDYSQTPIYQLADADIFNFVSQVAPAGERDGATDLLAAAWATIYMAETVEQEKRPMIWERTALAGITRCCAALLAAQYGAPTSANPTGTADNPRYGGILSGTARLTSLTVAAGIAFMKAHAATGNTDYLAAADRVAVFLRHAQSGNKQVSAYTVFPVAGGAYYVGGLAGQVNESSGLLSAEYLLADVLGAWFLRLLADVRGETASYGDATSTAFFSAPTAATLATMIADLTAFAETGARDAGRAEIFTGLSTTEPRTTYNAALNGAGGPAAWADVTALSTREIAHALVGIYMANGLTAKVTEMLAWLQAFASNENNRTPAAMPPEEVIQGITGTYNPALCPADTLTSAAPFTEADEALYDWSSFGLLSPILAAASAAAFRTSKDTLSTSVRYSTLDITQKYLGPIGSSGLSLQPFYRGSSGELVGVSGRPGAGTDGSGGGSGTTTSVTEGLILRLQGDVGLASTAGAVTGWTDQSGLGHHIDTIGGTASTGVYTIDGIPTVSFPIGWGVNGNWVGHAANMVRSDGVTPLGNGPRTIMAVVRPVFGGGPGINITGGPVISFMNNSNWYICMFELGPGPPILGAGWSTDGAYCWAGPWEPLFPNLQPPFNEFGPVPSTSGGAYDNVPVLVAWRSTGANDLDFRVNNVSQTISPATHTTSGQSVFNGFLIGNSQPSLQASFFGGIAEVLAWDYALSDATLDAAVQQIIAPRYPSLALQSSSVSSVTRAAMTGLAYRQSPGRYPQLRGN